LWTHSPKGPEEREKMLLEITLFGAVYLVPVLALTALPVGLIILGGIVALCVVGDEGAK
jgi:hypothetical protein